MADVANVVVTYDTNTGKWTAENPVTVTPGMTHIMWEVVLTKESTGAIAFGTQKEFPGILFDADWPGSAPSGNERKWSVEIVDKLKPGDEPVLYHYTVNTWYTSGDKALPPQQMSWDPDVEEDPGN